VVKIKRYWGDGGMEKDGSWEAGKLGSWEVKKCLRHFVPFLVLSAFRKIRSEEALRGAQRTPF